MKFNRIFALSLAAALVLTLASCGKKNDEPTPAPTDTPAVSESVQPSDTPVPSQEPSVEPEGSAPAESQPVQAAPSETQPAESAPAASELSAEDIWNTVSAGKELPDFMDLDDGLLSDLYGIDAGDLDSYVAKVPMINVKATEFFIAKVKDGKMDTVKEGIAKRQADLDEQWSMYLPDQLELVQNYKLVDSGDYVMFAVTEYADDIVKAFEDAVK